mmetsp:Transcript_63299/g.159633  ORF Transcript_63299/g.159633 Transcript_63299/m.159633 type:complete len:153 (-) Transcript_63299:184-642(-)
MDTDLKKEEHGSPGKPLLHEVMRHGHGHGRMTLGTLLLHIFIKLKYLGLAGHLLEALLELMHVSKKANHRLRFLHKPWMHLAAIGMVIVGHLAEHAHQEEENHEQEHRIALLEKNLARLQLESKGGPWSRQTTDNHGEASSEFSRQTSKSSS